MASNLLGFDNGFPTFTGNESAQEQIAALHSYLFQVREGLRYSLSNLGRQNFNKTELQEMNEEQKQTMEQMLAGVYGQLNGVSADLAAVLERINELGGEISTQKEWMEATDKDIKDLKQTVQVAEDGSAAIGSEGKRLNLIGEIYINGVLLQGGTE